MQFLGKMSREVGKMRRLQLVIYHPNLSSFGGISQGQVIVKMCPSQYKSSRVGLGNLGSGVI